MAFVYTGTMLKMYVNGQPRNNTNLSPGGSTTLTNGNFVVWADQAVTNGAGYINGDLAWYGMWNVQLTDAEILAFYNSNMPQFLANP